MQGVENRRYNTHMKGLPPIQNPTLRLMMPVLLVIANILCFACLVLAVLRLL